MIHILLNLARPLFVFDCETTGTNTKDDRIIEIGFQQWGPEGLVKEWKSLVNPLIPIPPSASHGVGDKYTGHGITDLIVRCCQTCGSPRDAPVHTDEQLLEFEGPTHRFRGVPTFTQLAPFLAVGLTSCDFAGKRVRFDLEITFEEMKRAGVEWHYVGARIVDIDRLESLAIPRDLGSLHEKYTGMKHDGAHGALSDVRASTTVIMRQLQEHPAALPYDLDQLHALQWPGWLTADGSFRMLNGVPSINFGKHRYKPMSEVPKDYYDYILREGFPSDVKALASAAKLGQYPTQEHNHVTSEHGSRMSSVREPDGSPAEPGHRGGILGL